ncbi:arginine--tRNA ligase [Campylobacterota bacterium]|nr:arginine--tRNA ligase [Campylobacterota bacterium]
MKRLLSAHIADRLGVGSALITKPKDPSFGHFCTPVAFSLAKAEKKPPQTIAAELCAKLHDERLFSKVEAVGGYVNFTLSGGFLDSAANEALKSGENYGAGQGGETILLEFVSANPTGPLHIGHARGAFYGDALLRLGRHLGYKIQSEYYINDAGNQIELLGRSLYFKGRIELLGEAVEFPPECYQGEYISDLAKEALEHFGRAIFDEKSDLDPLCVWAKEKMLLWIKRTLSDAAIVFDNFVSEKSLYDRWDSARSALEKNGALYTDSEGKVWLASTQKGDGKDRVVVRENGVPTYLAGDIVYHGDKFARGFDRYINIWGADHHGYIPRVKAAIDFLGYDSNRLEVLLSQMVALLKGGEPYKMSKRSGNFVTMEEVGAEVGYDALRFVFLTKRADTHLEFDVDLLKNEDSSNPVYYVNYAHARICSLFEKVGLTQAAAASASTIGLSESGNDLLFFALSIPETIEEAFKTRQPHLIADYLYKLATKFHRFYNDTRVIGSDNQAALLKLFAVVALAIRLGLKMLGITAKVRM